MDVTGAKGITEQGYEGCIELTNGPTRVVLEPSRGGRVLVDALHGWLAYVTRSNRLFVKTFGIFAGRFYGEMAGHTACFWYEQQGRICEIEPVGPLEAIEPGKSISFTENWWLFAYPYPRDRSLDFTVLRQRIECWL